MILNLNSYYLGVLIDDLQEDKNLTDFEYMKISRTDGGFTVKLTRSQVRRLNKRLPAISIESRYKCTRHSLGGSGSHQE